MCEYVQLPDGSSAIICGGHRTRKRCAECGGRATLECDGPGSPTTRRRGAIVARTSGTCDRALCSRCAIHVPPDRDFCKLPACRAAAKAAAAQLRFEV